MESGIGLQVCSENEPSLTFRTEREHHDCSVFFISRSSCTERHRSSTEMHRTDAASRSALTIARYFDR